MKQQRWWYLDLIISRLTSLDEGIDELNQTVKGLQTKVSCIETDLAAIKEKQKSLTEDCSHMTDISKFIELHCADKRKADINEC